MELAAMLQAPKPDGEMRIIETTCLCPLDRRSWVVETLGLAIPDPVEGHQLGAALLCGSCEARRRILFRGKDGSVVQLWAKRDADRLWAILLEARDRGEDTFTPRHKVLPEDPTEERILRDDRNAALRRILYDGEGRRRVVINEEGIERLGLNWTIPRELSP